MVDLSGLSMPDLSFLKVLRTMLYVFQACIIYPSMPRGQYLPRHLFCSRLCYRDIVTFLNYLIRIAIPKNKSIVARIDDRMLVSVPFRMFILSVVCTFYKSLKTEIATQEKRRPLY